jgi:hypothetical protein
MNYAIVIDSVAIINIPSFVKSGLDIENLIRGD